jgi:nicotinate-nucleotide--dimethylbenzimidazole phosphoribosyltransferase
MTLDQTLQKIRPIDPAWIESALRRQRELTKPPESLGRLEEIANRFAAIQESLSPFVGRAKVILFAADHGVCAERVNPYPQAVTAQMVQNFLLGGAAINTICRIGQTELEIVDTGVAFDIPPLPSLIRRAIAKGTSNFCTAPAMTPEQAFLSLAIGIERAELAAAEGCRLLGVGEMGIGNSTVASALAAVLTGRAPLEVTGRGTGADEACMERKISAVNRAVALHRDHIHSPLDLLARLGGFEIGAMCGLCLGAAAKRCAVLVDGFIATTAAALAVQFCPAACDYLIAAHRSTEPGHAFLLEVLNLRPLLDLSMRLGEGTGAALAVPLVRAALAAFTEMATFSAAGLSETSEEATT